MVDATVDSLLEANAAFYAAFEADDLDAMAALWAHGDHVVCGHPGWPPMRGWEAVLASWSALFANGQSLQFILTDVHPRVVGAAGWVHLEENLLGGRQASAVAAVNLFEHVDGRWLVVAHQGSGIAGS